MFIRWLGHSCFLLTSASGIRILTDPFNDQVGYPVPSVEADIVTTSHGHYDHNYIQAVKGRFTHLKEPGRYEVSGVGITGVFTFHDEAGGNKRGNNVVYLFDMDGIRVCHCGDLGHVPTAEQAREIGRVDVLLIPVGGTYTVDAAQAWETVQLLKPTVIIPMHYKTGWLKFPIDTVEPFVDQAGGAEKAAGPTVEITPENLPQQPRVLVLQFAAL